MINFIFAILHRTLSGVRQHYAYKQQSMGCTIFSMALSLIPTMYLALDTQWKLHGDLMKGLIFMIAILVALAPVPVAHAFVKGKRDTLFGDIHLWVFVETGLFTLLQVLVGANWITLGLALFPGMVLFQGFVNTSVGHPFIMRRETTDDPTGETVGIPFLGWKIPRINNGYLKLGFAIISVILFIVNQLWLQININLYTILGWL